VLHVPGSTRLTKHTKACGKCGQENTRQPSQPLIAERMTQSLQMNALKSFGAVHLDIGEWCSPSSIQFWLACLSRTPVRRKSPIIKELLSLPSKEQREKHVTLAQLLRFNWNLPPAKYYIYIATVRPGVVFLWIRPCPA
jgi:hypothetical protein